MKIKECGNCGEEMIVPLNLEGARKFLGGVIGIAGRKVRIPIEKLNSSGFPEEDEIRGLMRSLKIVEGDKYYRKAIICREIGSPLVLKDVEIIGRQIYYR
jgi:hypothetical protein